MTASLSNVRAVERRRDFRNMQDQLGDLRSLRTNMEQFDSILAEFRQMQNQTYSMVRNLNALD